MPSLIPDSLPITLAEAKSHLRVTHNESDSDILGNILAAVEYVQNRSQLILAASDVVLTYPAFPASNCPLSLDKAPVNAVVSIEYYDMEGATQSMDIATQTNLVHTPVNQAYLWPVNGTTWPATQRRPDAVTITYNAGYQDPDQVPQRAKQAILLMTAHYYDVRHPVAVSGARSQPATVPLGVVNLIRSLKPGNYTDP